MEITREIVERKIIGAILRLEKAYGVDFNKKKFHDYLFNTPNLMIEVIN